ncbi:MAG: sulfatase modifying factor 1 (C-alpha-formyglycine- generating enzyme 1) [Rhizobiaceae bacterium]|nr:sulfatase modifying factor 1 (C-alpha-formyglycine- generating enzyme 1) [Rhizobiaceae bacterium]
MDDAVKGCCAVSRNAGEPAPAAAPAAAPSVAGERSNAIFIPGGRSHVGMDNPVIPLDGEGPARSVKLNDYLLEAQTVTIGRFADFVAATGYVSEAERFGWSAVFAGLLPAETEVTGNAPSTPWWVRVDGASWRQPEGPGSSVEDRLDHPVTQVSHADALAFAEWVGGRLPSEAEWERAAHGGVRGRKFTWGDEEPDDETVFCNIWQGTFPHTNTMADGYMATAPARSFAPNEGGFYNMAGNVWEWTADPFRIRSLSRHAKKRNADAAAAGERLLKGGSFLCHISYCYRYRIAARMALTPDSAASNVGFRVAYDA